MKNAVWIAIVVVSMLLIALFKGVGWAETVPSIEKGTLVVREVSEKLRVPGVPEGLSARSALKLVTGELKEVLVVDKIGEKKYTFSFPPGIKEISVFTDQKIFYSKKWVSSISAERKKETVNWLLTVMGVYLPFFVFILVSIFWNKKKKRTAGFFFVVAATVVVCTIYPWVANIVGFVSLIGGIVLVITAFSLPSVAILGMGLGMMIGICASITNLSIAGLNPVYYIYFIVAAEFAAIPTALLLLILWRILRQDTKIPVKETAAE